MSRLYTNFSIGVLTPGQRSGNCGYWFIIQTDHCAHTAFDTVDGVKRWLAERALTMSEPLNRLGEWCRVVGSYRADGSHYDRAAFDSIQGIRSITLSNGDYVRCIIETGADGFRTVHTMNPNAKNRETFPHQGANALLGGNCTSNGKLPALPLFV